METKDQDNQNPFIKHQLGDVTRFDKTIDEATNTTKEQRRKDLDKKLNANNLRYRNHKTLQQKMKPLCLLKS